MNKQKYDKLAIYLGNGQVKAKQEDDNQEESKVSGNQQQGLLQQGSGAEVVGNLKLLVQIRNEIGLGESQDRATSGIQVGLTQRASLFMNMEGSDQLDITIRQKKYVKGEKIIQLN